MNRRRFIGGLIKAFTVAAVAPQVIKDAVLRLDQWARPHRYVFADWVTPAVLKVLQNDLEVAQFSSEFQRELKIGDTVRIKLPQRYEVR